MSEPAGPARPLPSHATDVLTGIALPPLSALFFPLAIESGHCARAITEKLAPIGSAIVAWAGVVPLFGAHSTADWRDGIAKLAGTLSQHFFVRAAGPMAFA